MNTKPHLWPAGAATGVGPWPGTDPLEACRAIRDTLPDLPHVPELPERGPGAGPVGRTVAVLVDLDLEIGTFGWRLLARQRQGADQRRARSLLAQDLDALEEVLEGYAGPIKVQLCGPWTMAANVELPRGEKVLADAGACRELAASLAEGAVRHVQDVRRRLPGVDGVLLEFHESALPAVMAGEVSTASGFGLLAPPDQAVVEESVRLVLDAAAGEGGTAGGVRVGAPAGVIGPATRAGARFVAAPVFALALLDEDVLGEAVEAGVGLLVGLDSSSDIDRYTRLWRQLDRDAVVVTPSGGLAHLPVDEAVAVLRRCQDAARALQETDLWGSG